MSELEIIKDTVRNLLMAETAPVMELRKILLDIEELINSSLYLDISTQEQENLQAMRRDLKARIRQLEDLDTGNASKTQEADQETLQAQIKLDEINKNASAGRDPQAENSNGRS